MACVAILGTGDMGSGVARALVDAGHRVVSPLAGRSDHSRRLATRAGIEDVGELAAALGAADIFLSIMPPVAAAGFARLLCETAERCGAAPLFVDCNAVSPQTVCGIRDTAASHGVRFVDVGIIGQAPAAGRPPVRLYASGAHAEALGVLATPILEVRPIGSEVGKASALKMAYASLTKGTNALRTAVLLAGARLGVAAELAAELADSQAPAYAAMQRIRHLAADAARWSGEMRQIAVTYESVGITPAFHYAAEWVFDLLAETPMAAETRTTLDLERTLEEAVTLIDAALERRGRE
jgi:3-hydroxyisobutyrate dehydrogenase-like beta-hydroxyacid dehydrogenase